MKRMLIASVIIGLMLVSFVRSGSTDDLELVASYSLSAAVEKCAVIARGTVTGMEGVWRDLRHAPNCTTDVTVTVTDMIKGEPNLGTNRIKYTIEGGVCIDPTGEWVSLSVSYMPKYTLGEEVLLLLYECDDMFCEDFPYQKLRHYLTHYGKRVITEKTTSMGWIYLLSEVEASEYKEIKLPLDLSIDMMKAAVKDKDAVVTIETAIKEEIKGSESVAPRLSQTLIDKLKRDVKAVLEKEDEAAGKPKKDTQPADSK